MMMAVGYVVGCRGVMGCRKDLCLVAGGAFSYYYGIAGESSTNESFYNPILFGESEKSEI